MQKLPSLDLSIDGMTCANCAGRVERALKKVPGVMQASVNLASERVHVQLSAPQPTEALIAAIERAGYGATLTLQADTQVRKSHHDRLSLTLALLLAVPLLVPMLLQAFGVHWMWPAWVELALATPVQFVIGARFYSAAWRALRTLDGNMDLLVVVGTTSAYGLSLYLWLTRAHPPHLYFEASAMVIALVLLGKYLETRARQQTTRALRDLQGLAGDEALREADGQLETVAIKALRLGDILVVKPGARFAADGEIIEGRSHANEALISGESLPVPKQPGDRVTGGALNGEGRLRVKVLALGSETTLARIVRLVEDAQAEKPPIQQLVDRVSRVFVPVVLALALLTLFGWLLAGAAAQVAIINAVSVLVIACPCALGLATPVAIMAGTGAAARHGILIKDSHVLEHARAVDCVVFDKTGTLTLGAPQVVHLEAVGSEDSLVRLAGALQQGSEHPLARAVSSLCQRRGLSVPAVSHSQALAGRGIAGQVESQALALGNRRLLEEHGLAAGRSADAWEADGYSVSWLIETGPQARVLGRLAFGDDLRHGARQAVAQLSSRAIACHLLTGDNAGSAAKVATAAGIDQVHAQVLPEGKAAVINALKREHVVAMVGDGINDAPALASADLGLAMASGTDVAMQTAGITLMRSDPQLVPAALDICRLTYGKIRQNLFWAFFYNLVGIPLAAAGWLSPVLAGCAMALSSVSVVLNALWLNRWQPAHLLPRGKP
ncbi:heavy metal translocating P-type ATPase [Pseudomonas sp. dw_358]|uniref:heavy metal translocating P-type ATPase n=1 Tax=Pseudomonas sp. dw_358 TaxID=2720083 RepID=UPI001BD1C07E|nr:heavy metal translocating P-type ATPase [Pseudomonas sp. dw_358]